ncbi:hypothetical protein ABW20_dc0104525 [Dactylellina cionopaga]|nr:hypothetical protein ABW20_dc0104525 [Dactylellina cionopaga]
MAPTILFTRVFLFVTLIFTHAYAQNDDDQLANNQNSIRQQAGAALQTLRDQQAARRPTGVIDWAPERNTIIISPETWTAFENALHIDKNGQNAVWYLIKASQIINSLMTAANTVSLFLMAKGIKSSSEMEKFELSQLSGWNAMAKVINNVRKSARAFDSSIVERMPPGITDQGEIIDSTVVLDKATVREQLKKLFAYEEVADGTILVSDTPISDALSAVESTFFALEEFFDEDLVPVLERLQKKLQGSKAKGVNFPTPRLEIFKRQNIGYKKYFSDKYVTEFGFDFVRLPGEEGADSRWNNWISKTTAGYEMYAGYGEFMNKIFHGGLPLMVEMLTDILFASNLILGRGALYPDEEFGISEDIEVLPYETDVLKWMGKYPEFGLEGYVPYS